jgi:hypothetical protein
VPLVGLFFPLLRPPERSVGSLNFSKRFIQKPNHSRR